MDIETPIKKKSNARKERMAFVQFRIPISLRRDLDKLCRDSGFTRPMYFRAVISATVRGDVVVTTRANGVAAHD